MYAETKKTTQVLEIHKKKENETCFGAKEESWFTKCAIR